MNGFEVENKRISQERILIFLQYVLLWMIILQKIRENLENTEGAPTNRDSPEYAQECNDEQLEEIKRIQKEMGYDFDVGQLDQKTVGKRLHINPKKACLVSCWMIMYVLEGATVEQAYQVMEQEIKNGNIKASDSWMADQLNTSESMAKLLKGDNYDGLFLQSPWKNKQQVLFNTKEEFQNSEYKYAFVKYSSTQSNEFHYTLLVNNNNFLSEYDPFPGGISSLTEWSVNNIEYIEPKGWYRR